MNKTEYNKLYKRFFEYVDSFKESDSKFCKLLEEKLNHIKRVTDNACYIANNENWSEENCLIAELCGLFHDIGRFPQYKQYKTFSDSKSVNHGEFGYKTIKDNNIFNKLSINDAQIILDAVHYHNALNIPTELSEKSVLFTKLTRDADKIDIFFMLTDAIKNNNLNCHQDLIWNLPFGEPNPNIIEKLLNNSQALYSDIKSATDVCLLQFCWLYGINYKSSLKKIIQNQTVETISSILPKTPKIKDCIDHINSFLESTI